MILEGNERGFGANLAEHLMNARDNDHVTVHAVDGFMTDYLLGAFAEAEAISEATQCRKYLFSLSLNPPQNVTVSVEAFEQAISDIEKKLGLVGQPRAIVFHEKNGRRHAHCVWSRIDATAMKAINLPHYKLKLADISRELYRRHEWDMPAGFQDKSERDPLNYSRQEAGQAKRLKHDPKETKAILRSCFERSDSLAAFAAALKEEGFLLARGDRRGFVAVDGNGKIWSLSRWCGVNPKVLRRLIGSEDSLPTTGEVLQQSQDLQLPRKNTPNPKFAFQRSELIARQRKERDNLLETQEKRRTTEIKQRRGRLPKGLSKLFAKVTGRFGALVKRFETDAKAAILRDRAEQQDLITSHIEERRVLERAAYSRQSAHDLTSVFQKDPRQSLKLPKDDLPFTKAELLRNPALILSHVSKTKAEFTRSDLLTDLAKRIDDPLTLSRLADEALRSSEAVKVAEGRTPSYTTRDYLNAQHQLRSVSSVLHASGGFAVSRKNIKTAVRTQNADMKRAFGGKLSKEQETALNHILGNKQIASIVGLAGAGKSTLLKTAMEAWTRQGFTVHGAALAGKAADGLEEASNIQSRTLASLEASWENGYEPIKEGDILVVDEVGMIGTRQLARITSKMQEIGAKLVLVGDPDQLQPIEAGTPFKELVESLKASKLTEIHRQKDNWQKQASRDLANGDIDTALKSYTKHDCVHRSHKQDQAIESLVESYAIDTLAYGNQASRLALAYRRKDVHALNQAIRTALRQTDNPPKETLLSTDTGKRAFAKGDRIVFSRNERDFGVRNGMLGTVQSVRDNKMVVTIDGDPPQKVTFDPRKYQSFDHGYAVTIHKSQGATIDRAYILGSHLMDRHLAYVAMTRHRDTMQLYVSNEDKPRWAEKQMHMERMLNRDTPQRSGPSMG